MCDSVIQEKINTGNCFTPLGHSGETEESFKAKHRNMGIIPNPEMMLNGMNGVNNFVWENTAMPNYPVTPNPAEVNILRNKVLAGPDRKIQESYLGINNVAGVNNGKLDCDESGKFHLVRGNSLAANTSYGNILPYPYNPYQQQFLMNSYANGIHPTQNLQPHPMFNPGSFDAMYGYNNNFARNTEGNSHTVPSTTSTTNGNQAPPTNGTSPNPMGYMNHAAYPHSNLPVQFNIGDLYNYAYGYYPNSRTPQPPQVSPYWFNPMMQQQNMGTKMDITGGGPTNGERSGDKSIKSCNSTSGISSENSTEISLENKINRTKRFKKDTDEITSSNVQLNNTTSMNHVKNGKHNNGIVSPANGSSSVGSGGRVKESKRNQMSCTNVANALLGLYKSESNGLVSEKCNDEENGHEETLHDDEDDDGEDYDNDSEYNATNHARYMREYGHPSKRDRKGRKKETINGLKQNYNSASNVSDDNATYTSATSKGIEDDHEGNSSTTERVAPTTNGYHNTASTVIMQEMHSDHLAAPIFKCTYDGCTYTSHHRANIRTHYRTHTKERPFQCRHLNCTFTSSQIGNRNMHERIHTGIKPHACNYEGCRYASSKGSNLRAHKLRIHGEEC